MCEYFTRRREIAEIVSKLKKPKLVYQLRELKNNPYHTLYKHKISAPSRETTSLVYLLEFTFFNHHYHHNT
ncbi:MAG: hypothetical protein KAX72_10590, partial [Chitinophagales bacterium]|nr:hypothetical protein [Chitinophagales bacterium]